MTPQQQYAELLALTQLHLLQEFSPKNFLQADAQNFVFFKKQAQMQTQAQAQPLKPQSSSQIISPPPLPLKTPATPKAAPPPPVNTLPPPTPAPIAKLEDHTPKPSKMPPIPISAPSTPKESTFLTLEPLGKASEMDLSEIRKILEERFPSLTIIDETPSDAEAKQVNSRGVLDKAAAPEVVILYSNEPPLQQTFLANVAKAIQICLNSPAVIVSARKLENEGGWNTLLEMKTLKLIMISKDLFNSLPDLTKRYRETTQSLDEIPVYFLSDPPLYLKDPKLKQALWEGLKQLLCFKNTPPSF